MTTGEPGIRPRQGGGSEEASCVELLPVIPEAVLGKGPRFCRGALTMEGALDRESSEASRQLSGIDLGGAEADLVWKPGHAQLCDEASEVRSHRIDRGRQRPGRALSLLGGAPPPVIGGARCNPPKRVVERETRTIHSSSLTNSPSRHG